MRVCFGTLCFSSRLHANDEEAAPPPSDAASNGPTTVMANRVEELERALCQKDDKISELNKAVQMRDVEISNLRLDIARRDVAPSVIIRTSQLSIVF